MQESFPQKQIRRRFVKEDNDYYDDSDEDKDHRDASEKMYNTACGFFQFLLNPSLCCYKLICWCRRRENFQKALTRLQTRHILLIFPLTIIVRLVLSDSLIWQPHPLRPRSDWEVNNIQIKIRAFDSAIYNHSDTGGWKSPAQFRFPKETINRLAKVRDFGEIQFNQLRSGHFYREIDAKDSERYEKFRDLEFDLMNKDPLEEKFFHDEELDYQECRRPKWMSYYFPNCNSFHEVDNSRYYTRDAVSDIDDHYDSYYFSHGYYRDAWMLENADRQECVVLKMLRFVKHDFTAKRFANVQRDGIVMERLNHSPYIVDMYGHCGASLMVQRIEHEIQEQIVPDGYMTEEELDDKYEVQPQNSYSIKEKLYFALSMAESLATLHGFEDGVITHADVQLCQWLRTYDNRLVLGDFNRAEIMAWNDHNNEYCNFNNGYSFGNYRSPEEYTGEDLDEKIDVFSFGNNVYALLTGLWPFYENEDDTFVQSKLVAGNTSFIDERYQLRSYGEGKMVQLIEMCWKFKPKDRPDIFEIVEFLRIVYKKVEAEDEGNEQSTVETNHVL